MLLLWDLQQVLGQGQKGDLSPGLENLGHSPWPLLTKLTEEDDIEAYLEAFEMTTEETQWLWAQWVFLLRLYLPEETLC